MAAGGSFHLISGPIYFNQSNGGSVKVVIKDGKVSSFRFYVTIIDLEYDTFKASV